VLVLTGHSDIEHLGSALLLDADAFLTKPLSRTALERSLSDLFPAGDPVLRHVEPPETYSKLDLTVGPVSIAEPTGALSPERRMPLTDVPENAVLARDLTFHNGRLLLSSGSRLTARILYLLSQLATMSDLGELWIAN
jgi:hypothetical protein